MTLFERHRKALGAIILALALGVSAKADDDPANLSPAALKKAEATYKDAFGAGHEKALRATKLTDKSDFAKRLLDALTKAGNDAALQEVLRKYALQFAQSDAVGISVAMEIHKAYLVFPSRKAASLDKLGGLQEKSLANEPLATKPKVAFEVIKWYRDAAIEYDKQGSATLAIAAVGKARAVARKYTPNAKDLFASLDVDERRLQARAADQAETERLKQTVEKIPDDLKSRVELGCRYLRFNRVREAADQFRVCGDEWPAVAKALTEVPPPDAVTISRLLTKAAARLPAEDKRSRFALFEYARNQFDEFRVKSPDRWLTVLPTYAALLDRMFGFEPASQTAKLSTAILFAQLDLAEADTERGAFADALFSLGKARAATKTMKSADAKDFTPEIDAMEKGLKARVALEADVGKLQMEAATLDAKGQLSLGIGLLRIGKLKEAVVPLKASGIKAWQDIAAILAAKGQANPLELANALRSAAGDLKGEEKTDILALARDRYEAFLATNPPDIEKNRVELIAGELPIIYAQLIPRKTAELFTPASFKMFSEKAGGSVGKITEEGGMWKVEQGFRNLADMGWQYRVVEKPIRPGEVRYIGFCWKTDSNHAIRMFLHQSEQKWKGYLAGKNGDPAMRDISPEIPRTQTIVVRDLYKDFGGGWSINGFGLGTDAMTPTYISGLCLGRTPEAVRRAMARMVRE